MMKTMSNYSILNNKLLIEVITKGINITSKEMVMEFCTLSVVEDMKGNGRMIKCMGSVNFIMKIILSLMKDIGKMMSLMGKEESTILSRSNSNRNSITKISLN